MDTVTDLAARAVSFITLIQDTLLKGEMDLQHQHHKLKVVDIFSPEFDSKFHVYINSSGENRERFETRAIELVWVSTKDPDKEKAVGYTVKIATALVGWLYANKDARVLHKLSFCGSFPTPYSWREAIREVMYLHPAQRVSLAGALQYLPIQVVLALGGGFYDVRQQRMLQIWKTDATDEELLLTPHERNMVAKCGQFKAVGAEQLVMDDEKLADALVAINAPLPFELVFKNELREIGESRFMRSQEQSLISNTRDEPHRETEIYSDINDPFARAKAMKLYALAFSGGGVRSATFNLGILQGLARKGLINRFDYMSTVSGGGYIGSWLAAWIKRDGSVIKVNDRLNPEKSSDPFGEELKPIRWLRMFSNYFAPQSSIMGADSWTIGVTWLRNTLLNQLIILLIFMSVLLFGNVLFRLWSEHIRWPEGTPDTWIYACSALLLLPAAAVAGLSMYAYNSSESLPLIRIRREQTGPLSNLVIVLALVAAYLVSAWLFSRGHIASNQSYASKLALLAPFAVVCFVALCLVAALGRYDACMKRFDVHGVYAWLIILLTAAIAAFIALLCLALAWQLIQMIQLTTSSTPRFNSSFYESVAFTFGIPLVLEVFSIMVVARMASLGKYFPDERREWWGRMGAIMHSFALIWILFAGAILPLKEVLSFFYHKVNEWWAGVATIGGWVALVGSAVKAAFSSRTSGKGEPQGALSTFMDVLGKIGPYLFFLGILVFVPVLVIPLRNHANDLFAFFHVDVASPIAQVSILTLLLAGVTYLLARKVGVNEFSMHHFYRNRLVRAYLGATRRTTERQKTSNPFTGFDAGDDVKLTELRSRHDYYGPYPILNTALNASQVTDLDRQDRKAESFTFSPLYCGFDFSMARASADLKIKSYDYGYRETHDFAYEEGPTIGTAMAISGAAVNPNQGYHSSPATAFLLTIFNVRMGWWIGNTRKRAWKHADPRSGLAYIISNLLGKTNTRKKFVCLSDGGHFDNMGLYELVRRKCSFIILGDGEQDNNFTCEGLANAIRRCRIDFGAEIIIDVREITNRNEKNFSSKNFVLGKIKYAGEELPSGVLLYIKSSVTGEEPVDVHEYSLKHSTFPHQTTADQFFDEEQFESYRKLGLYIADLALTNAEVMRALEL